MNKTIRRVIAMVILLALAATAVWIATRPKPISVVLWTVGKGRVESSVANTRAATVTACRRAKLSPSVGGRIAALKVKEGDRVETGQLLLEVWHDDLSSQLKLAQTQAETARSRADQACQLADVATREAARQKQLSERGFLSIERADRSASEARASRAGCAAARAEIAQALARIVVVNTDMERTVLKAPFAGVVAEVTGELGEHTTPSPPGIPTPPAIDLIDDSCLYVTAPIDEVDVPAIKLGMKGRISVDAFPGRRFEGRVRRIAPYVLDVEKQARTADVEVEFANPGETSVLLVGYSADAEIVLEVHEDVVRVPAQALLEGNRVLVYREADGALEERKLAIGLANWEYAEVKEGLAPGERIVVSLERSGVKAGAQVTPEAGGAQAERSR